MDAAMRLIHLNGLMRQAVKLIRGVQLCIEEDRFRFSVFSAISWFKVRLGCLWLHGCAEFHNKLVCEWLRVGGWVDGWVGGWVGKLEGVTQCQRTLRCVTPQQHGFWQVSWGAGLTAWLGHVARFFVLG
jgi:hypothetical protein